MVRGLKVLFLAAEATPFVKVGGLGDVAGELPRALRRLGVDVRLALPLHAALETRGVEIERTIALLVPRGQGLEPATVHCGQLEGLPLFLVDGESILHSAGLYGDPAVDVRKFTLFSLASLAACEETGWLPDVVHANDWHTAPAVIALARRRAAQPAWQRTASLLTVHNLAYMGAGGEAGLQAFGLGPSSDGSLPNWARALPLPLGLLHADGITAVSPTYAREILSPEFGCGLETFLATRQDRIRGILNGIDPANWNPTTDSSLVQTYDLTHLGLRPANKAALAQDLGWTHQAGVPVMAMVTRLDFQKGVDLVLQALPRLLDLAWRFVLLGTGDQDLEQMSAARAAAYPDRIRFLPRFDPRLARRIYAGADLLLVPSRFEPCGLTQMIAMRYGCIPLVRAVGGLRDTILPAGEDGSGTGFLFQEAEAVALEGVLRQAISAFQQKDRWRQLQEQAMRQDFSWEKSAAAYHALYRELVEGRAQ